MTVWADPPLSRREARQKVREESGVDTVTVSEAVNVSEEELAAAIAAEEAARYGADPSVRTTGSGGRRAQWNPSPITSSFAPIERTQRPEPEDNTAESQAEVVPELTMSRRELRALRERAAAAGQPDPVMPSAESSDSAALRPAIVFLPNGMDRDQPPTTARDFDAASAAPIPDLIEPSSADWTFRGSRRALRGEQVEEPAPEVAASPLEIPSDAEALATPSTDTDLEYIEAELVEEPDSDHSEAPVVQQAAASEAAAAPETLSPFDALFRSQTSEAPEPTAVEPAAKPYGHWTTQAALDDAAPSVDGFLGRDVGVTTGAITTHALVLPSIPESGDQLLAPLTNTGEIMITGSIDLPRTFGSTGAHPPRFDHPDVDALIDESDREDAVSTSAPVRAIRAVSSTASSRGVIEAPAKPKSKLPLIGGIALGGIILVVGAFVAAALVFNVF